MATYFVKNSAIVASPSDSNDGLDALGIALSLATYDDTGNSGGEKHLSLTGGFTSYTFVSGDRIYLSAGAGIVTGLYEIASKVDNNAVLLVTSAGSDSSADVSSASGPWLTIQKSADTAVAGDTILICADATYTPTVTTDFDTNDGTSTNRIVFKGAGSRGVDDDTVATVSGSSLSSNIDIFTWGTNSTGTWTEFFNLRLTAPTGASGHCVAFVGHTLVTIWQNCRFDNAGGDGMHSAFHSQREFLVNCEIDNNGGAGLGLSTLTAARGGWLMWGCSIHDNTGIGVHYGALESVGLHYSIIYDNGSDGINIEGTSGNTDLQYTIDHCVIFGNTGDGIDMTDTAMERLMLMNTVLRSNGGYGLNTNSGDIDQFLMIQHLASNNNTNGHIDINSGTLPGSGHVTSDPLFINETDGAEDFTPQPGSPLLEAAFPGTSTVGISFGDIGAIQRQAATAGGFHKGLVKGLGC